MGGAASPTHQPASVGCRLPDFIHLLHLVGRVLSVKGSNGCGMARGEQFTARTADEVLLVVDALHAVFLMSLSPELI
jgi:hypothetical protein